jgi:hypothetical protein
MRTDVETDRPMLYQTADCHFIPIVETSIAIQHVPNIVRAKISLDRKATPSH